MQSLFQKITRFTNSNAHPSSLPQLLLSICQHLKKHSQQLFTLTNLTQDTKTDTLTLLGGKISLSEFPSLLQKYKPTSSPNPFSIQLQKLKLQMNQMTIKLQSYRQFQSLFDKGNLKEYEMRSLEDMILGNQEYIKGSINELIVGKADRVELQRLYQLNDRFDVELTNMAKGLIQLAKQPSGGESRTRSKAMSELEEKVRKVEEKVGSNKQITNKSLQQLENQFKMFTSKITSCQTSITSIQNTFFPHLDSQNSKLQQKFTKSISTFQQQRQSLEQNIQQKIMISLYESQNHHNNQIHELKMEIIQLSEQIMQLKNRHSQISNTQILQIIDSHFKQISYESTSRCMSDISMVKEEIVRLGRRIDLDIKERKQGLNTLVALRKDIETKISIKDIENIVDKLATIEQTKQIINETIKQLQQNGFGTMREFIDDQIVINETLCSENMLGRWFWQGRQLRNGNLIPWQKQMINTSPENFCWEQGTYQIIIMKQGIYRIQLCVFGEEKKKPSIQLIVNGNAVMSAVNNSSYVIHHSSGRLRDTTNNSNKSGGVLGISLIDFLIIPGKSRVAVSFVGETGKGFISLKQL